MMFRVGTKESLYMMYMMSYVDISRVCWQSGDSATDLFTLANHACLVAVAVVGIGGMPPFESIDCALAMQNM
jgi:hypothetical protein